MVLQELNPKIKEMYEGIRWVLAKYRSGKVPKAFKVIPHMKNWEQVLHLTRECWGGGSRVRKVTCFSIFLNLKLLFCETIDCKEPAFLVCEPVRFRLNNIRKCVSAGNQGPCFSSRVLGGVKAVRLVLNVSRYYIIYSANCKRKRFCTH